MKNRHVGQKRVPGVCWCCASSAPVRPCKYWCTGIVKELCAKCEKEQAVNKPRRAPAALAAEPQAADLSIEEGHAMEAAGVAPAVVAAAPVGNRCPHCGARIN